MLFYRGEVWTRKRVIRGRKMNIRESTRKEEKREINIRMKEKSRLEELGGRGDKYLSKIM